MSDLRDQINNLSAAKKADLLDTVWESLEADAALLTDTQRVELDYRIARHEENPSDVIPREQVWADCLRNSNVYCPARAGVMIRWLAIFFLRSGFSCA
jgi:putative addiction module component (TIGR02574 family)